MKKYFYIALIILFTSCVTKKINRSTEKTFTKQDIERIVNAKTDSIQKSIKSSEAQTKKQFNEQLNEQITDLEIKFKPKLDSLGNLIPVNYERVVDGKIKESIKSVGGEIIYKTSAINRNHSTEINELETKIERFESLMQVIKSENETLKAEIETIKKTRTKEVKKKGFSFMVYVWLFVIVVALAALFYFRKKLKSVSKLIG